MRRRVNPPRTAGSPGAAAPRGPEAADTRGRSRGGSATREPSGLRTGSRSRAWASPRDGLCDLEQPASPPRPPGSFPCFLSWERDDVTPASPTPSPHSPSARTRGLPVHAERHRYDYGFSERRPLRAAKPPPRVTQPGSHPAAM